MNNNFLNWLDKKIHTFPMHIEITYSKICDWQILIYKRGCADEYSKANNIGEDVVICDVQDCDIDLAFAKAEVATKEWFSEFEGY